MNPKPATVERNVLCMKWGRAYGAEYVNVLHAMVVRHLSPPFRFLCLTDDTSGINPQVECRPLPRINLGDLPNYSGWRKLSSFSPELDDLSGQILFLDLDLVIVASIDSFFEHPGDLCIIENWTQRGRGIGNSSVYRYPAGGYRFVFEDFERQTQKILRDHRNEQIYLSRAARPVTFWPETWCRSFKRHCLPGGPAGLFNWVLTPKLPEGARIIVFHGHPKPPEAARGEWPQSGKHVRPTPWVAEHWR